MNEQSFEYVLVPTHVRSPQPTRLVEMRRRSLKQFAASAKESFPTSPANAPAIRIHRVSLGFLVRPRLRTAILETLDIRTYISETVVALVGDDLFDHADRNGCT